jgi:hypothetical protein
MKVKFIKMTNTKFLPTTFWNNTKLPLLIISISRRRGEYFGREENNID